MRPTVAITVLWLMLCSVTQGQPPRPAKRPPVDDAKVKAFLEAHRGAWRDLNVPESDGKLLCDHLKTVPDLETTIDTSSRAGVSISYKRRAGTPGEPNHARDGGDSAEAPAESADMQRIFNGKDLTGWDGDPRLWSVKDGAIHGETTAENPAQGNTFLIWNEGVTKDFQLRLSFRCIATNNSGIQ